MSKMHAEVIGYRLEVIEKTSQLKPITYNLKPKVAVRGIA